MQVHHYHRHRHHHHDLWSRIFFHLLLNNLYDATVCECLCASDDRRYFKTQKYFKFLSFSLRGKTSVWCGYPRFHAFIHSEKFILKFFSLNQETTIRKTCAWCFFLIEIGIFFWSNKNNDDDFVQWFSKRSKNNAKKK